MRSFFYYRLPCILGVLVLLATSVSAIPPIPPYKALAEKAEVEGVTAVRKDFRLIVEDIAADFDSWQGPPKTLEEFSHRLSRVNMLFSFLHAWLHVEARDVREKGAAGPRVILDACEPALLASKRAIIQQNKLKASLPRLKLAASPQELERFGPALKSLPSSDRTRDDMVQRMIALSYVVGDKDLLNRTFRDTGEELRTARTADQYLKNPPDLEKLLGPVKKGKSGVTPQVVSQQPVTPEEEATIRNLIDRYGQALINRDSASFQALFADPDKFTPLQAKLNQTNFISFDTSQARFLFERAGPNSVRVHVDGIAVTRQKMDREVDSIGRKTFHVILRDGEALIDVIGDR